MNGTVLHRFIIPVNAGEEVTGLAWIDYYEDGTKIVKEYDTELKLIKETVRGVNGELISQ